MESFEYQAPMSLADALTLLGKGGKRARPLAGGTDLLVHMRNDLLNPEILVDVKKIPELNELHFNATNGLVIGAAVPLCRIYEHYEAAVSYPCLMDAVKNIGGVAIQGRATVGGNLCNASPSGDSIPALTVLEGACNIASLGGRRKVPVEEFCTAPGRTVLDEGELLVSVQLPPPKPRTGAKYIRFIPRGEMDIAVVGVGASLVLSEDYSKITRARLVVGAVAPTPLYVKRVSEALTGKSPTEETWAEAAALAKAAAHPISDVRGSAKQRLRLVDVLTRRALRGAYMRARGEKNDAKS